MKRNLLSCCLILLLTLLLQNPAAQSAYAAGTLTLDTGSHGNSITIEDIRDGETLHDVLARTDAWPYTQENEDALISENGQVLLGFSTSPMDAFDNWDALAEAQIDPDAALSDILADENTTLYLDWATVIDNVALSIEPPVCGTSTDTESVDGEDGETFSDITTQTNRPQVSVPGNAGYRLGTDEGGETAYWIDYRWAFTGTFEGGEIYQFEADLVSDYGYIFTNVAPEIVLDGANLLERWRNGLFFKFAISADPHFHIQGYLKAVHLDDMSCCTDIEEEEEPTAVIDEEPEMTAGAPPSDIPHTPQTGDPSDAALFFCLMMASGCALVTMHRKRRRQ